MRKQLLILALAAAFPLALVACGTTGGTGSGDRNRITSEQLAEVDVSTVYEAVQRLRPRWLEARTPAGMGADTWVVVFLDRTFVGGVDELRDIGLDAAVWLEYRRGVDVVGELFVPGDRHVDGAIIVHTRER